MRAADRLSTCPGRGALPIALLIAACVTAAGCFRYVPVEAAAVDPGETVRVRFTDDASVRLVESFGRITTTLEGRARPVLPDSLVVSIWIGRDYAGTQFENVHQSVAVGLREVTAIERRELSRRRTAFAAAGAVALFAMLVQQVMLQEDPNPPVGGTDPPPPPAPAVLSIPLGARR